MFVILISLSWPSIPKTELRRLWSGGGGLGADSGVGIFELDYGARAEVAAAVPRGDGDPRDVLAGDEARQALRGLRGGDDECAPVGAALCLDEPEPGLS